MRLSTVLLIALVLAGCGRKAPDTVSFKGQIQPILNARCVSCHGPEKAEGKIVLVSYDAVMNSRILPGKKPLVIPSNQAQSWLYILCATDQPHYRMPPDTSSRSLVPREELLLIANWIKQGAQNN